MKPLLVLALGITGLGLVSAQGHGAGLDLSDQARIERALPSGAPAGPLKARRLLIFDRNTGYGGHPSIVHANHAFRRMGETTGAYATEISQDPEVFRPESLARFDAVFLNNTVGNLFTDPELRESLVEFVYRGGGLMGVHGTTVAFTQWPGAVEDWPEFAHLIGARGANHRESTEHVFIKLDDPAHPINAVFAGAGWDYRDEFFRVHEPYSRERLRVLFSIDTVRTDLRQGRGFGRLEREDDDYALAWVRGYGRGRVFYCTIAHNPYVFADPRMLAFYLAAVQFALGDLPGSVQPSAPRPFRGPGGVETSEWVDAQAWEARKHPFFEAVRIASNLGQYTVGGVADQPLSEALMAPLSPGLSATERQAVRLALETAGVRLVSYALPAVPSGEDAQRRLLGFARRMGVERIVLGESTVCPDGFRERCAGFGLELVIRSRATGTKKEE